MKKVLASFIAGVVCLSLAGTAFAAEAETSAPAEAAEEAGMVLGTENEEQQGITITNETEQDITYITTSVYDYNYEETDWIKVVQEALIEQKYLDDTADGSYGPKTQAAVAAYRTEKNLTEGSDLDEDLLVSLLGEGYDGNLLQDDSVFAAGEKAVLYFAVSDEKADDYDEMQKAFAESDPLTLLMADYGYEPTYLIDITLADGSEYTLHAIPADAAELGIFVNDGIAYVGYTDEAGEQITTYDLEKAVYDMNNPVYTDNSNGDYSYDDYSYDDYSYDDYSYDYGYDDTSYDDTSYDDTSYDDTSYDDTSYDDSSAVYEVSRVAVPSCDDGSHGYYEITYSDGTVAYEVY